MLLLGINEDFITIKFLPIALLISSPLTVPSIILIFNHYRHNSNFLITKDQGIVFLTINDEKVKVDEIRLYHRYFKNEEYFSLLPWDRWYYFEFVVGNKKYYKTHLKVDKDFVKYDKLINHKYPLIKDR